MVKIRLRRVGRKKLPVYRIVVADRQSPRDGQFIEIIGQYNPRLAEGGAQPRRGARELLARRRRAADGHRSLAAPQGGRAQGAPRGALAAQAQRGAPSPVERERPRRSRMPVARIGRSSGGCARRTGSAASSSSSRSPTRRPRSSRPAVVFSRVTRPAIRFPIRRELTVVARRARTGTGCSSCASTRCATATRPPSWRNRYLLVPAGELDAARGGRGLPARARGMRVVLESGEHVGDGVGRLRAAAGAQLDVRRERARC